MDLFPWDICCAINCSEAEVINFLSKRIGYDLDVEEKKALKWDTSTTLRGRTIQIKNNAVIMWVKNNNPAIVAHEALHAATFILECAGLKFSQDSDEAWAYTMEKIITEFNKLYENQ
jgi:hypothetical protein